MAIVCIKIGENEPENYVRYNKLYKHLDIVEVLSTGTTMGREADRHFFGLNVDTSHLSEKQFNEWRGQIMQSQMDDKENEIARRLYRIDISLATFLSDTTRAKIEQQGNLKSSIKPTLYQEKALYGYTKEQAAVRLKELRAQMEMDKVNRLDEVVSFNDFANMVVNKETGETLAKELKIG